MAQTPIHFTPSSQALLDMVASAEERFDASRRLQASYSDRFLVVRELIDNVGLGLTIETMSVVIGNLAKEETDPKVAKALANISTVMHAQANRSILR